MTPWPRSLNSAASPGYFAPSCTAWSRCVQTATTQRPWHECAPGVRHLGHLAYLICRVELRRATSAAGAKSDVARASTPSWRPHAALQASLRLRRLRTQPDADRRAWSALTREEPPFWTLAPTRSLGRRCRPDLVVMDCVLGPGCSVLPGQRV